MKITDLEFDGLKLIEPKYFEDNRGYYVESYSQQRLKEFGINNIFVQDNHSLTIKKGTIRGIHFQNSPLAQTKLVRCTRGSIKDVVVDLRKGSLTYKKWMAIELTEKNRKQILIPKGFGHAFLSLTDNVEVMYKVDEFYEYSLDRSILWNDSEINIDWGIDDVILSEKDKHAKSLADSDVNFVYGDK